MFSILILLNLRCPALSEWPREIPVQLGRLLVIQNGKVLNICSLQETLNIIYNIITWNILEILGISWNAFWMIRSTGLRWYKMIQVYSVLELMMTRCGHHSGCLWWKQKQIEAGMRKKKRRTELQESSAKFGIARLEFLLCSGPDWTRLVRGHSK